MAKAQASNKPAKGFEETLWDSANKLRGSVESAEYKHVVLSLIFLKFISDKFEQQKQRVIDHYGADYVDMVDFYAQDNVFYLPEEARWEYIQKNAKQDNLALTIDTAMRTVEKNNATLAGALPDNYFSRLDLSASKLASLIDTIDNIETIAKAQHQSEEDIVGRVYEYFLGKFAANEGQRGGEFYTPKSVVTLLVEMLEPYQGKIYDPCCGSGGMFVQSLKFIEAHKGSRLAVSIYGQEYANTTRKLAKMNLAIRGIAGNLGEAAADSFFRDQHPDLKADFILANPPFNQSQWRAPAELTDDPRWADFDVPPTGNANYAWILHMLSKLSHQGAAGFVMANGSMSSSTSGEGKIRQQLIEDDLVECMIALPGQLFFTTQIPVCLWFLTNSKKANAAKGYRDREDETLFIDARHLGSMISRKQKDLSDDDIATIARTFHAWRGQPEAGAYEDIAGFCKSASFDEIKGHDFVLTPGRYVGAAEVEDDGIPFETKMAELTTRLGEQFAESAKLEKQIKQNLAGLGYGI
ncbi:class I SAM-dependent DNA methyltransferase [Halomonas sp. IOP_31]|uniref:class I SAM-dependent DNA methyltransferase n=1 Tax=Halomonas sp. IOP_31 TaxID=2876584 RepID=UPI001E40BD41|nr:class I SAM-dependent DNA methyltransferase [Halomonas sp. IOP_31]MCD6009535.1 type I restriction-modification system subunit M [Halomonas sp. IOP_31]